MASKNFLITLDQTSDGFERVPVIKAIRTLTGLGLKESKEVTDRMVLLGTANVEHHDLEACEQFCREINQMSGVRASVLNTGEYQIYSNEIRAITAQAVLAGHDQLAADLMTLCKRYGMTKSDS